MKYLIVLSQLFISEWIWGLTWGLYHNVINILFMLSLLKLFLGIPIVSAVLIAFSAQLAAFMLFNLFVISILILGFGIEFDVLQGWSYVPDQFYAIFFLGLIFVLLQGLFFFVFNSYLKLRLSLVFVIIIISNALTVLTLNLMLPSHL